MNSISKRESKVIEEIKDRDMIFFSPNDISRFLDLEKRNTYNLLSRMEDKELIERVESGRYILTETISSRDVYEIASNMVNSSYLGFLSALHFHDLTDQVPRKVQIATTVRKKNLEIQGTEVEFVKIQPDDYFGYQNYNGVISSNPEKTVIDCLRLPSKAGDFSNILDIDFTQLNTEKLVRYCKRTESSAVSSRLGFMLEQNKISFNQKELKNMIKHYSKLDPSQSEEKPVKEWKIYSNRDI